MSDTEPISTTNGTASPTLAMPLTLAERIDQIFPTLTTAQIARIAAHGRTRRNSQAQEFTTARRSIAVASVHQVLRE